MISRTNLLKGVDRYVGGALVRALGWWRFKRQHGPPFVEIRAQQVRRVLFIRPGGMGDLLLLLPVALRVRRALPDVRLTLVGERRNRAVAALTNLFDEVLCYDEEPARLVRRLLAGNFDVAVDTEQFHYSSAIFAWLSGAPARIGFKTSPARNEFYTHLVDYPMSSHESDAFALLVHPLCGEAGDTSVADDAPVDLIDRTRLPKRVPGLEDGMVDLLTVFPYGGAREKAWPAERWADIVRQLAGRREGPVVLVGGDDSTALAFDVGRLVNDASVISLVGSLSLSETAAVLARSRLYIGCDTGITHLAHALGTPSVVIFGGSDERKWGPLPGAGTSVTTSVPCRPCAIFGYFKRCHTIDCMNRIQPPQVWQAIDRELSRR